MSYRHGSPSVDLVGKIPVLEFAVRSLYGGSRLVSLSFGLLHRKRYNAHMGPLVDDDLSPDYVCIGIDVRVEIAFVHEGRRNRCVGRRYLHERDRNLAVVDTGSCNDVADRDAEVVGCQMNLIPYEPPSLLVAPSSSALQSVSTAFPVERLT